MLWCKVSSRKAPIFIANNYTLLYYWLWKKPLRLSKTYQQNGVSLKAQFWTMNSLQKNLTQ